MYRLFHKLFGWHYVAYIWVSDVSSRRVKVLKNGLLVVNMPMQGYVPFYMLDSVTKSRMYPLTMSQIDFKKLLKDDTDG